MLFDIEIGFPKGIKIRDSKSHVTVCPVVFSPGCLFINNYINKIEKYACGKSVFFKMYYLFITYILEIRTRFAEFYWIFH